MDLEKSETSDANHQHALISDVVFATIYCLLETVLDAPQDSTATKVIDTADSRASADAFYV
jgi:hypothetical protein